MFEPVAAFSGFAVKDLQQAQAFYADKLGLTVDDTGMGLQLHLPGGTTVFVYPKPDHQPASFTILNFVVTDIDAAVDTLAARGMRLEKFEGAYQDDKGIARGLSHNRGPDIAWFRDPSGNILSVLQDTPNVADASNS